MSRYVSKGDKLKRILGFSIYLALIVSFVSLLFIDSSILIVLIFIISIVYFYLIFYFLASTKHIHFNVLLNREEIKDILYKTEYKIIDFVFMKFVFIIEAIILTFLFFAFYSEEKNVQATAVAILFIFSYIYLFVHKIKVYLTEQGIIFDYLIFVALIRWDEIKNIDIKKNEAIIHIKQKHIKRRILLERPKKFEKIVKTHLK